MSELSDRTNAQKPSWVLPSEVPPKEFVAAIASHLPQILLVLRCDEKHFPNRILSVLKIAGLLDREILLQFQMF